MLMLCAFDMSEKFSIAQKWLRIVGHLVIYILNIYIAQSIIKFVVSTHTTTKGT